MKLNVVFSLYFAFFPLISKPEAVIKDPYGKPYFFRFESTSKVDNNFQFRETIKGSGFSIPVNIALGSAKCIAGIIPIAAIIMHLKKNKRWPHGEDAIVQYATLAASLFATCSGLKNLYYGLKS